MIVPVEWIWIAERLGERVGFGEWIKSELRTAWGQHYGFKILNQTPLPVSVSERLAKKLIKQIPTLSEQFSTAHVGRSKR